MFKKLVHSTGKNAVVYYQNVNGLRTKLDIVERNIALLTPSPDIVILTETNLHPGVLDSSVGLKGYNVFRRDRYNFVGGPNGGGVLVAVKSGIAASELSVNSSNVEHLFIEISNLNTKLIIGVFYAPPRENIDVYNEHMSVVESLKSFYSSHEFVILGDYNLPNTLWSNYSDLSDSLHADYCGNDNVIQENVDTVLNHFSFLGFHQYYPVYEKKGYTLDLAFSSLPEECVSGIVSSDSLVPIEEANHVPSFFQLNCAKIVSIESIKNVLNFNKADYDVINSKFGSMDWERIFGDVSLDYSVDKFYSIVDKIVYDHVPTTRVTPSSYPEWYSDELISNVIRKKRMHKQWLEFGVIDDYAEFKKIRAACIRLSLLDRQKYIDRVEKNCSKDTKYFWNYFNKLTKNNYVPDEMFLHDKKSTNKREVCDLFARNFELAYLNSGTRFCHQLYISDDCDIIISLNDIINALKNMKNKMSLGPDGVPAFFIKKCVNTISKPLLLLFNLSLKNGCMPSIWKKSFVTPVFKAGNRRDILNYRPISILSSIAKLFDSIMANKLTDKCIRFIISQQHGFVAGRSTLTNLILYSDYISNSLNERVQVDSIYLDFEKAFDSVNHDILIFKLFNFGIKGTILKWIASYLSNRELKVNLKGNLSGSFFANSGVPQGSHLGPLLFVLFINDVVCGVKTAEILIFADDIKIYFSIDSFYDQVRLQKDLDAIWEWSLLNRLKLNCLKCKVLSFSRSAEKKWNFSYKINDTVLENVVEQKDLGVIFEKNFAFDQHLNATVSRAFNMLGFVIRASKEFKNVYAIIAIYKSLVRSLLTYASIIWSPYYDIHVRKLNSVQHKFLRYIAFKSGNPMSYDNHDYSEVSLNYQLESIKSIHVKDDLCFVKKSKLQIVNSREVNDLFTQRNLNYNMRNARELFEQRSDRDYVYHSTPFRLRRRWNRLPLHVKSCDSLVQFKIQLKPLVLRFY